MKKNTTCLEDSWTKIFFKYLNPYLWPLSRPFCQHRGLPLPTIHTALVMASSSVKSSGHFPVCFIKCLTVSDVQIALLLKSLLSRLLPWTELFLRGPSYHCPRPQPLLWFWFFPTCGNPHTFISGPWLAWGSGSQQPNAFTHMAQNLYIVKYDGTWVGAFE